MKPDSSYFLDFSGQKKPDLTKNCVRMGTAVNPKGETLDITSKYLVKNDQPWLPVMGEFHYSRYPQEEWEQEIMKMKACGIEIIATYVFWIHHEEEKGKWNWAGNRDLRHFVLLCAKHGLYSFPRIGPWCHGEVRNGGHPDWIRKERPLRQNKSKYMAYTRELYRQIHEQLKGFYFKEGGPVIGVQLENERTFDNPTGLEYMLELKKTARAVGIDVPYYTATGWQGYDAAQREFIPMWGAYPDAPWSSGVDQLIDNKKGFHFSPYLHESDIGTDLLPNKPKMGKIDEYPFPFLTVEMGAGTQCTHHRRPIFNEYDGASLIISKIGSGANGIGYYVFHGGSNPIGSLSTLQESKASFYPNDLPIISYDFYAPIGEWGQIRPSYKKLKQIHFLIQEFGHEIATYPVVFPKSVPTGIFDPHTLRWTARSDGQRGFIFINNYQRHMEMDDIEHVQFQLRLNDGKELVFPEKPIKIPCNTIAVLPFNLKIDDITILYSTAQPFCILKSASNSEKTLVMQTLDGINAELSISNMNVRKISGSNIEIKNSPDQNIIRIPEPGTDVEIKIELTDGFVLNILVISQEMGLNAWKAHQHGRDMLVISESEIISTDEILRLTSLARSKFDVFLYPPTTDWNFQKDVVVKKNQDGVFVKYDLEFTPKTVDIHWDEVTEWALKLKKSKTPTRISRFIPIKCYPLYDTSLSYVKGARYWKVTLPKNLLDGVSNIFLNIEYEGDTQAIYINNRLVADNFFAGEPMRIGLKRVENEIIDGEIILLVTPMSDLDKVYLEKNFKNQFNKKILEPIIKSITAIPQYTIEFSF